MAQQGQPPRPGRRGLRRPRRPGGTGSPAWTRRPIRAARSATWTGSTFWALGSAGRARVALEVVGLLLRSASPCRRPWGTWATGSTAAPTPPCYSSRESPCRGWGPVLHWRRSFFAGALAVVADVAIRLTDPLRSIDTWSLVAIAGVGDDRRGGVRRTPAPAHPLVAGRVAPASGDVGLIRLLLASGGSPRVPALRSLVQVVVRVEARVLPRRPPRGAAPS